MSGEEKSKLRVLLGCPVRQKKEVLKAVLESLDRLEKKSFTFSYYFVDDNTLPESSHLLSEFQKTHPDCYIRKTEQNGKQNDYYCTDVTHTWRSSAIWKVAAFKDTMIQYAKEGNFDYLFLIDSDIVLHPKTIEQLISDHKDIVANIFWTQCFPDAPIYPQVWLSGQNEFFILDPHEQVTHEMLKKREAEFLQKLKNPGVYSVGGLGACTLISKRALEKGVSFARIPNISLIGEDRHFCVRAVALGLDLFVDTFYPAYHIYRDSDLPGVEYFSKTCEKSD